MSAQNNKKKYIIIEGEPIEVVGSAEEFDRQVRCEQGGFFMELKQFLTEPGGGIFSFMLVTGFIVSVLSLVFF